MENEIFDEIDEEVRQDKLIKFIKNNKNSLLFSIAVIAVVILLVSTYISNKKQEAELYTAKLVSLFFNTNAGNDIERETNHIINNAPKDISNLAKLISYSDGKETCTEMFNIYSDKKSELMLRYAAFIGYIFSKMRDTSVNKMDILHEIDQVLSSKNIPFKSVILELKGYIFLELYSYKEALEVFTKLLDDKSITSVMKNRVGLVVDYIKSMGN